MVSVRFLHWIGFDPKSVMPPPNDEATEALGFLGYDFMGRIVETAIQLRIGDSAVPQLPTREQLELKDINRALRHSSIQPVPLYSGKESSKGQIGAQLYFGPGFERRLEMEMDELVESKNKRKRLTEEEIDARKKEDELFAELAKPPQLLGDLSKL